MLERFIALLLVVILAPIFLIISLLLFMSSGKSIIYQHHRYGYKYKKFYIYKYRTMIINNGPSITYDNDERITKIGKILRKYKIDEIPQLINVIKGEMNLIGPRPEAIEFVDKYHERFKYLNVIKPGMSDIVSIIFKDEAKIINQSKIDIYENEILPIKNQIVAMMVNKQMFFKNFIIIILSILAIINHKLSLHIISKFFLPYNEKELRMKLNYLLSINIF